MSFLDEMKAFVLWFVQEFPVVLLEPPISAFVGLAFLALTVALFERLLSLKL